jgi:hypothetical protein
VGRKSTNSAANPQYQTCTQAEPNVGRALKDADCLKSLGSGIRVRSAPAPAARRASSARRSGGETWVSDAACGQRRHPRRRSRCRGGRYRWSARLPPVRVRRSWKELSVPTAHLNIGRFASTSKRWYR